MEKTHEISFQKFNGISMEISYVFAHVKLPWFTYHGYSMECNKVETMVISWKYHGLNSWYSMEYPWYVNHGNFMWAKTYENPVEIPWVQTMVIRWNFRWFSMGKPWCQPMVFHGMPMECKPW